MYSYFVYIRSACLNGILDGIVCSLLPVGRRERTVDDLWTSSILINKAGTQEGYTQTHTLDSRNIKGPDESLPMCVRWRCGLRLRVLSPVLCCALFRCSRVRLYMYQSGIRLQARPCRLCPIEPISRIVCPVRAGPWCLKRHYDYRHPWELTTINVVARPLTVLIGHV